MSETTKQERIDAIDTAISRAGGIIKFAKAMGVTHQAIYSWKRRGWAPADKALIMETLFAVPRTSLMEPSLAAVVAAPPAGTTDIL